MPLSFFYSFSRWGGSACGSLSETLPQTRPTSGRHARLQIIIIFPHPRQLKATRK
jgi:hypothetical protein